MNEDRQQATSVDGEIPGPVGHVGFRATARNKVRAINYKYAQPTIDVALVSTACKLLPLVHLIEAIKPHIASEPVFEAQREKINAQMALVLKQLKSERPKRKALTHAFKTLSDVTLDSVREVKKEELKNTAKGFVVATIKNAPSLITAAKQAGLLS